MADQQASIRIRVLGGIRAALEAESVADAMDQLADQTDQAARAAVRAAFAFKAMQRWLRKTFTQANLTSAALLGLQVVMAGLRIIAISLATLALPAFAIALYNVAVAAGVVAVAFAGGFLAILGAAGLMAIGVISRFKQMSGVIGSAAYDLQNAGYAVRGAFRDATAGGADAMMRGLARGLQKLVPLLRSLEPSFTAIGKAFGTMFDRLFGQIAGMGPELKVMFAELVPTIKATGNMLGSLLGFLVQIATVGAPLVTDAFEWLDRKLQSWTGTFTDGKLDAAKNTLRGFARGVKAFFSAFAAPIKPIFGDAMTEFGAAWKTLGPDIGTTLGWIVRLFMDLGRKALPYVTRGMSWLAERMPAIVAWIKQAASDLYHKVLVPLWPFVKNVLWPVIKGVGEMMVGLLKLAWDGAKLLAQGLGWIGDKAAPLRGAFELLGNVIAFVFGGGILRAFGGVLSAAGRLGGGIIGLVSRIAGGIVSQFGRALSWVWGQLSNVGKLLAGLGPSIAAGAGTFWDGFKERARGVFDWIKRKIDQVVRWIQDLPQRLKGGVKGGLGGLLRSNPLTSPAAGLLGLATGGTIKSPGWAVVGERGPELVNFPAAATVFPNDQSRGIIDRTRAPETAGRRSASPQTMRQPIVLQLDRRTVAEAVVDWLAERDELQG